MKAEGEISSHIRRWLHEQHSSHCQECGWGKVHPVTGKVPLAVHHRDGNSNNNRVENLELLCPNCHALTENFGRLNKGKGRKKRYGGACQDRTDDIYLAKVTLSQLS